MPSPPLDNGQLNDVSGTGVSDVWAVGNYDVYNGLGVATLHYDGTTWTKVPNPAHLGTNTRGVVAISPTDAWVVGDYAGDPVTMHWDGVSWALVPAPSVGWPHYVYDVSASSSTDVSLVGSYEEPGVGTEGLVEHWDGVTWTWIPTEDTPGGAVFYDVAAVAPDDVWAVGYQGSEDGFDPVAEHWDGTAWTVSPIVIPPYGYFDEFFGVSGSASDDVWAVGYGGRNGDGLLEHWDGTAWTVVPTAHDPRQGPSHPYSVVATSPTDAWAAGDADDQDFNDQRPFVEHWDGTAWSWVKAPTGGLNGALFSVARVAQTRVWAVGVASGQNGPKPLAETSRGCQS